MHVILLGPPGAGKGTQAQELTQHAKLVHVSSGDLFRAALRDGTELGLRAKSYMDKGDLVPDALVIDMVLERINQPDCKQGGVLFDGFPRTAEQARALDAALEKQGDKIDAVVYFGIADELLIKRISGRITSKSTGAVYNRYLNPPRDDAGNDISDNEDFFQRPDDNEATVQNRLRVYHEQTSPLIDYYRARGVMHEVDGAQELSTVTQDVLKVLGLQATT